jgi:8-oxo-dGTP pyrophosphatase MutT (NUDIX family)
MGAYVPPHKRTVRRSNHITHSNKSGSGGSSSSSNSNNSKSSIEKRVVVRRKVMVIPYAGRRVLMVRDRGTGEWGFVSGGVKRHEKHAEAAVRELREETSDLLRDLRGLQKETSFDTWYRTKAHRANDDRKGERVRSEYRVFWVRVDPAVLDRLPKAFAPNEEIVELGVGEYHRFAPRWELCDSFVDSVADFRTL